MAWCSRRFVGMLYRLECWAGTLWGVVAQGKAECWLDWWPAICSHWRYWAQRNHVRRFHENVYGEPLDVMRRRRSEEEMMEHRCEANDRGLRIEYNKVAKRWYLKGVEDWAIYHCPYCGMKLEPPDVKIEVKRVVLEQFRDTALKLFRQYDSDIAHSMYLTVNAHLMTEDEWIARGQ